MTRKPEDIQIGDCTLAQIIADHALWLLGLGGRRADLSGADLSDADLSGAVLRRADLSDAVLSGAVLSDADLSDAVLSGAVLWDTTGNRREIRSMQIDTYSVAYTATHMQIGCKRYPIEDWRGFNDDAIAGMDGGALEWWRKAKPLIFAMIDAYPATPTGKEAAE